MSMQNLKDGSFSPILSRRWKSYVTASAAVVAGTAGAHGVIVNGITPPADLIDPDSNDQNIAVFNFQLLTNTDLVFIAQQGASNYLATAPTGLSFAGLALGGFFYPSNVPYGEIIGNMTFNVPQGGRGDLAWSSGYSNSQFVDQGGYVAFRFSTTETGTYHGWAQLSLIEGAPTNTYRLERYAYANASDNLTVGQMAAVPEPSSMASLALGAVGLLSWRRSRRPA